ncbi:MAG: Asp-tRNA(Asn)/Glu-tRNA(Gln) amidotransferase subunit GatC [Verrucomicrobiota bacterium]|nr:Asp-tRNA(Asn)/Glu-tRNA(Gln) amidotransferase subunit GatC [Verrucomicrobiota bacterium]
MPEKTSVKEIAALARISLSPQEEKVLQKDMDSIVEYVELLSELDLEGIEPTMHAMPLQNVTREDKVVNKNQKDAIWNNTPQMENDLITVPPVIGEAT